MSAPPLDEVLVRLCRGQVVLGGVHSVGAYTPAVPDPAGYAWCVMDRGGPVVLAFDAFDAALWFVRAEEAGGLDLDQVQLPIRLPYESAELAARREDLLARFGWSLDAWLVRFRRERRGAAATHSPTEETR